MKRLIFYCYYYISKQQSGSFFPPLLFSYRMNASRVLPNKLLFTAACVLFRRAFTQGSLLHVSIMSNLPLWPLTSENNHFPQVTTALLEHPNTRRRVSACVYLRACTSKCLPTVSRACWRPLLCMNGIAAGEGSVIGLQ